MQVTDFVSVPCKKKKILITFNCDVAFVGDKEREVGLS